MPRWHVHGWKYLYTSLLVLYGALNHLEKIYSKDMGVQLLGHKPLLTYDNHEYLARTLALLSMDVVDNPIRFYIHDLGLSFDISNRRTMPFTFYSKTNFQP